MTEKKHIDDYSVDELLEYLDQHGRRMADPTSCKTEDHDWHPANDASLKLWRCVEALRDVHAVLGDAATSSDADMRARKLKVLATPVYSLLCAIRDLCNDLLSNPETASRLQEHERTEIVGLGEAIVHWFPLDKGTPLRDARDKTSAHIEAKLGPDEVRKLLANAPPHEYGRWLHQSILILLDLSGYNVYAWAADAPEHCVRLMANEPFGLLIKEDPEIGNVMLEIEISRSPRNDVNEACRQVVLASEWMFRPGQHSIVWSDKDQPRFDVRGGAQRDS